MREERWWMGVGGRGREPRGERRRQMREKGEGWRVGFWNVAGMGNKDKEFWKEMGNWDIVTMVETWVEEKGWERVKGVLPKSFKWTVQYTRRDKRKERVVGRLIMGVREELEEIMGERRSREGVMRRVVKTDGRVWKVIGVYIREDKKERLDKMVEWGGGYTEEEKDFGGDFNARTGVEGRWEWGEQGEGEGEKKSMDGIVNVEGSRLLEILEE